mgnify:CR=1 FL=1
MEELKILKEKLSKNNHSCVIGNGKEILYTSEEKGIKPLLDFYNNYADKGPVYIADKIIGKGAAFLIILLSAEGLYTPVVSESALDLLKKNSVHVEYDKCVSYIKNRTGDGRCPIEAAVLNEEDSLEALKKILNKLKELTTEEIS